MQNKAVVLHKRDGLKFGEKVLKAFVLFLLPFVFVGLSSYQLIDQSRPKVSLAYAAAEKYFQIAVLSDTQYYTAQKHNGTFDMFKQQIDWIWNNQAKEKIAYVVHLGDISYHGDQFPVEWERAKKAMYGLEKPLPGLPNGIPYGLAVGNHDSTPNGDIVGTADHYETTFGRKHFLGRTYYGGSYQDLNRNDNHYDLFSANGEDFIVLYLAYNEEVKDKRTYHPAVETAIFAWGEDLLKKYSNRKAIIVSHSILRADTSSNSNFIPGEGSNAKPGLFTNQGKKIYNHFKKSPNVFLMLCGHRSGEALRIERYEGRTIKIMLSDYQSRRNAPYGETDRNGGNGLMRLLKLDQDKQLIKVRTFAPRADKNIEETDEDSQFSLPLYN